MHLLYTLAIVLLAVVLSPWFVYQAIRYRKYIGSLAQRMGYLPVTFNFDGDESIWIHAVSVGEALTARALIADLRERYPELRLFVSTTTLTGQQIARGKTVLVCYDYGAAKSVPLPDATRDLLERIRCE